MTADTSRPLQASVDVAAPPDVVWRVVSDVRRTGEWSPECTRVVPLGGVRAGGWLLGLNRRGRVRWATLSRVTRFEPGRQISWDVVTNGSRWTYRIEPTDSGTRITETRETPDGVKAVAAWFTRRLLGGTDVHDRELAAGMADGLARIKALVER
jgi:uncharacterized protein YndB with AHSA1/START domain